MGLRFRREGIHRYGWAAVLAALLLFSGANGLAEESVQVAPASPVETCLIAAEIQSIEPAAQGLVIRATAPISAHIVQMGTVREAGFAPLSTLTIDFPRTALGSAPAREQWNSGPFVEMRITRYREGEECGLRLRLVPRAAATWLVQAAPNGVLITSQEMLASIERWAAERQRVTEVETPAPAGAVRVSGTYAGYALEGTRRINALQIQAGFAERLPSVGTMRGFISDVRPRTEEGAPFGALGLSGFRLGKATADVAAGDLLIPIGGSAWSTTTLLNSLIIRGAGGSLLLPNRAGFQIFGGKTARSTFIRSVPDGVRPGISQDQIVGGQMSWEPRRGLIVGGGWMLSDFHAGPTQHNLFEMIELRRSYNRAVRIVLEQSKTDFDDRHDESGYAITLEPRISTSRASLAGAARFISSGFHAPAGAGFFSTLRRSYDLSSSFRPDDRTSLDGSAGQAKTFSLFDPQTVGTLTSSRGGSVGRVVTRNFSSYVSYSETDVKSDPGALVPTDSHTSRYGVGTTLRSRNTSTSARLYREDVGNRIDPHLNLEATRIELDQTLRLRNSIEIFDRLTRADSHRTDGSRIGSSYGVLAGVRNVRLPRATLSGQVGYNVSPAGVSLFEVRQGFATLGLSTSTRFAQGSVQLTYQRLEVGKQPARSAWLMSFNGGRLLEWGRRAPVPPFDSRAMRLVDTIPAEQSVSLLRVVVFEDRDGDGRRSSNERGVKGIAVIVDERRFTTNAAGEVEVSVAAGSHRVTLPPEGPMLDYFVSDVSRELTVRPPEAASVEFALRPAGRLSGRVLYQGELTDPSVLQGIQIVARSAVFERSVTTDVNGEFRFGVLPEGAYVVSIERKTLAREAAVEGPAEMTVTIRPAQKESITFTIRKATARERFGIQGSRL